jgi:hypothetical protein
MERVCNATMTISKQIFDRSGLILWIGLFLAILVMAWWAPDVRSVVPVYRQGSAEFLAGRPLYDVEAEMGYLYAPAFAALYIPLFKLGPHVGDLLWRVLGFGVITFAVVRQVRKIDGPNPIWLLSFGLFLAIPMTLGAVRNGQSTILLAGACWLLTLSALEGRRAETFLWASLAIVAKPTAIVMLLLVGALRPRVIPVLVLALLFVLALPYAFAPFAYVNDLYRNFAVMLTSMAVDKTGPFITADFTAPFAHFGILIPQFEATIIRVIAALLTLVAVLWFDHKAEARTSGLVIFLLGAFYMCVFNPRVEYNTYAMLAVPAGLAIAFLWQEQGRGVLRVALMTALFLAGLTGVERHVQELLQLWFRPIVMIVIGLGLLWWFWDRTRKTVAMGASRHG